MLRPFAASVAISAAFVGTAAAQQVVAVVNGDPITAVDIQQRGKLIQLSTQKAPDRKTVLDELIDEKLKLGAAKRFKLDISDSDVDNTFAGMAQRMRATPQQFTEILARSGVHVYTLKNKIRADMAWSQIIRGKFQASLQLREKDIAEAALLRKKDDKGSVAYEYTLRPILLIVPKGAGEGAAASRMKEAEALRTRFQNCEAGIALARGMRDVAVREPIIKTSGDLNAKLREVLDAVEVGKLTPPDITDQGVEVFALCNKRQSLGDTPGRRDAREELVTEQFQAQAKKYLRELRRGAMIEMR